MFFYWEDFCLVMYVIYVSVLPNRCRPLRGWKTRPEKERRGRPNRHHTIPAPRERGLIQPFFFFKSGHILNR